MKRLLSLRTETGLPAYSIASERWNRGNQAGWTMQFDVGIVGLVVLSENKRGQILVNVPAPRNNAPATIAGKLIAVALA